MESFPASLRKNLRAAFHVRFLGGSLVFLGVEQRAQSSGAAPRRPPRPRPGVHPDPGAGPGARPSARRLPTVLIPAPV